MDAATVTGRSAPIKEGFACARGFLADEGSEPEVKAVADQAPPPTP
jgi:hypothetical protein